MAMPGRGDLASLVRRRMRVDDRPSAERKWNRFRTRGPKRPDSQPETRVSPGRPKVRASKLGTEEKFSLSMNLILNPIEKELRVRRQKIKIKTGEEEHAEEVLRMCFKENVCYGGEKWANNPLNLSLGQNQRSGPQIQPRRMESGRPLFPGGSPHLLPPTRLENTRLTLNFI